MTRPSDAHLNDGLVGPALDDLQRQRHELDGKWLTATRGIRSGEGGIALSDTLQRAFLEGYRPKADEVTARAERRQGQYGELIGAGERSVDIYRNSDSAAAQTFPEPE
jgi:hypothetical protein